MTDLHDRVLSYLDDHTTLNLATTGPGGLWAAAILYVHDDLDLYFTSVPSTRHAVNIDATHHAACTIIDECTTWQNMKGMQVEGKVVLVEDVAERTRVVADYLRRFPFAVGMWNGESDPARIGADPGIHAFFRLTPTRVLFTDNEHHPQGREELPL